ncbi:RIMS-binding protein 2 [Denticeps clupeoides]|uniref:RIMS-binding protein 2 n=1 Tax=Denticeps clupeoides TaxID=299321 RepID=UPI0010A2BC79|nr:RIMS-binding protein 2-like [Denticeps clupeoides]XP_028855728.1 RIMS-binding protein 2-like [Denticeps clupeoides]XP_028855729.1 RIMS-binding protein 2-like [Denticeps clupeoides]XP_028855730.1 RIMS-binding protein 2-like [Denticeps clupeoides]
MYDPSVRLFVALFSYDPAVMSPNQDSAEELPFHKGQVIKIYGDKDADGFYHGTCGGQSGYVPSNMVSEIPIDDGDLKLDLFHQGFLPEATPTNSKDPSEASSVLEDVVHRMVAIFDYDPWESSPNVDIEDELPFRSGDIIYVFGEMDHDGFYYADLHGHRGLVPSNYLEPLPWD